MDKREDRRDRTWRRGFRRLRERRRVVGVRDHAVGWYAKRTALGCGCHGRRRGQPKIGSGICCAFGVRGSLRERREGRRLARAWLLVFDLDGAEL